MKEKDLQTVEQLNDGDFLRVVTADGGSRKVDKDAVGGGSGGGVLAVYFWDDTENQYYLTETSYREIYTFINDGGICYFYSNTGENITVYPVRRVHMERDSSNNVTYCVEVYDLAGKLDIQFSASSVDDNVESYYGD